MVWAQESTLHFDTRQVDLSPLSIDSFVVVPGGVYFLSRGELWFTDLSRARGTGLTGATGLSTTRDAGALRVEVGGDSGPAKAYAYDLGSGASIAAGQAVPATDADMRGTRERVALRPEGSDEAAPTAAPVEHGWVPADASESSAGTVAVWSCTTRRPAGVCR